MTHQMEGSEIAAMPPGSVIITPAQMYAEIRTMAGKVDNLVAVIDPALSNIRKDVDDHELRLRAVERRLWIAAVIAAGSGAGIAQLLPLIGS